MNSAILSALSALSGSTIGAIASIGTTWLTQHYQAHAQRASQGISRREQLFSQFIDLASKLYADALTHNLTDLSILMPLYSLKSQIQMFAAAKRTADKAEEVVQRIVLTYYEPNQDFKSPPTVKSGKHDVLQDFAAACRAELMD